MKRLVARQAVPFIFNTIGVDDGIAMSHGGMKYSLPSRELIADCVEAWSARIASMAWSASQIATRSPGMLRPRCG